MNRRDLQQWARRLKTEAYALYLAYKDPRAPWYARVFAAIVVGYAFSPIDLIPDPIPVLGYLDDVILIPLGIALTIRMIPTNVLEECRQQARSLEDSPVNRSAAGLVIITWLAIILPGEQLAASLDSHVTITIEYILGDKETRTGEDFGRRMQESTSFW